MNTNTQVDVSSGGIALSILSTPFTPLIPTSGPLRPFSHIFLATFPAILPAAKPEQGKSAPVSASTDPAVAIVAADWSFETEVEKKPPRLTHSRSSSVRYVYNTLPIHSTPSSLTPDPMLTSHISTVAHSDIFDRDDSSETSESSLEDQALEPSSCAAGEEEKEEKKKRAAPAPAPAPETAIPTLAAHDDDDDDEEDGPVLFGWDQLAAVAADVAP